MSSVTDESMNEWKSEWMKQSDPPQCGEPVWTDFHIKWKEVTITHRGTKNKTTEEEIRLSQREIKSYTSYKLSYSHKRLTFRFHSQVTELCTEEEQALLLYLASQICKQFPLKLWLDYTFLALSICVAHKNEAYTKFNKVLIN